MRQLLLFLLFSLPTLAFSKSKLYIQTFGQAKATPIIFLHGGPGYNVASFEQTTAQALAEQGLFALITTEKKHLANQNYFHLFPLMVCWFRLVFL